MISEFRSVSSGLAFETKRDACTHREHLGRAFTPASLRSHRKTSASPDIGGVVLQSANDSFMWGCAGMT